MKLIEITHTSYCFKATDVFKDTTLNGCKQKLRNRCPTVIFHSYTESEMQIVSENHYLINEEEQIKVYYAKSLTK